MITFDVGGCEVTILPVVNGIRSESDKVRDAYGHNEAYAVAMGIEGIQAIKARLSLESDFEVSELDIAYSRRMMELTGEEVVMPSPAICTLVDLAAAEGKNVIPLDMNDADFTEMYCATVPTYDFVKEHRLAKKGMKKNFSSTAPADFALEWDEHVNTVKSYRQVSLNREKYIADQIRDIARYRNDLLAVCEIERFKGILSLLEGRWPATGATNAWSRA